jgi:energy-coupling factor transporter ATP-binding protein EcfA2
VTVDLLDRRLLFVTGKGGVGKSTVAAALALLSAQRGRRTLACEIEAKGDLADFFETSRPGFEAEAVQPNLWAMAMDTEASLREYLRLQLHIPGVAAIRPLARAFDFVATAAPGVREAERHGIHLISRRHFRWLADSGPNSICSAWKGCSSISSAVTVRLVTSGRVLSKSAAAVTDSHSRMRTAPGPPGEYISRTDPSRYSCHSVSSSACAWRASAVRTSAVSGARRIAMTFTTSPAGP